MSSSSAKIDLDQRGEKRADVQTFVTIKGHDLYGHEQLEALITDATAHGATLHTAFPFEVTSQLDLYIGGDFAATCEVIDVFTDDSATNPHIKVRLGVEIISRNPNWPY